ncbi:RhoGEF domain protein [Teladorsagia circumcincta]|uniref:RhoGEF domain protein n=1 Tax=Teladorsagia circumcincta TaxID=45464 RepID=A0A2G9UN49_TELCI|nr:RhoGEF domain protein [Teladorsagia circumcincta]
MTTSPVYPNRVVPRRNGKLVSDKRCRKSKNKVDLCVGRQLAIGLRPLVNGVKNVSQCSLPAFFNHDLLAMLTASDLLFRWLHELHVVIIRFLGSHFSKHETFINGVKQMSKSTFKAFVEYKGPEGGYRVKLADNADDLSEEETEDDDRASRCYSEITDSESDIQPYAAQSKQQAEAKKRYDKAWFAAKELVDSEQRYVEKLRLLDEIFRQRVVKEAAIDKEKQQKLFANISSLHQFHNTHFLPQLMEASRDWHTTKRIANVVRKQAPFLKMYSEYTNNYERASRIFEELKKKKKFADVVREIEEYKKHLLETDVDYEDTALALQLVLQAASHANEMMKKLDGFGKVIEVQEQLGNSISLVSPGRELLKTGTLQKISSTTEKTEERTIFLFNDLILLAGERKMIGLYKYRLRAVFHACHTQICEGDNLEREHSFYIRGSDGNGPQRCVELFSETQKEKNDWVESICAFRGSLGKVFERYFVVRNDFCLYSYNSCDDDCALAMLPLPGCEVKLCGERFTFSLRVGSRRMYTVTVEDEQNQLRWMAVLDLAANAQLQQTPEN